MEELLNSLDKLGVKINLRDGNLVINAPKGSLSNELREEISENKPLLIKYLENTIKEINQLVPVPREKHIPLSHAQQRMWFLYLLNPESAIYNIPAVFSIKGNLNISAMTKAVNTIIKRHETLRTNFYFENGNAYQRINEKLELDLNVIKVGNSDEANQYIEKHISKPFNLTSDSLLRIELLNIDNTDEYIFVMTVHHIISDAWSCGVFAQELAELYKGLLNDDINTLPDLNVQYIDYSYWQKKILKGNELKTQLDYWQNKLKDCNGILSFPTDKKRPKNQTFSGNTINKKISDDLKNKLKEFARENSTTLFVVLMSAFHVLLNRYTSDEDINVGFPVSGRNHKSLESLIGFFVNTLVIRANIDSDTSFKSLVKQVHETTIEAFSNQDIPFEKIVESLNIERNTSYTPLFQFMFVMQNIEVQLPEFPELDFKLIETNNNTAKFDLTLSVKDDSSVFSIEYRTDLFEDSTIQNFLNHYENLLESIVSNPEEKTGKLNILKDSEYNLLMNKWKVEETFHTDDLMIHKIVEQQAQIKPDSIALVFENQEISYKELNEKANQLANYLINNGVKDNTKVGLYIDISTEMIISLLAILKAGGTYIPLAADIPSERLDYIINDSKPPVIITKNPENKLTNIENINIIDLDKVNLEDLSKDNLNFPLSENNQAYIIYTSGSTGKPKGVIVTHKNVIRLFKSTGKLFDFKDDETWVLFHSFAFDYSIWEIWGCFYWGGKLLIASKELTRNPELFYKTICEKQVTVLNQTPSAFYNFSRQAIKSDLENSLRYIVLSGEALDIELLRDWYNKFPDNSPQLFNSYGITETTVFVTFKELDSTCLNSESKSPIGLPLADLSLQVLDKYKNPVPLGVAGELYVGGDGVTLGYLNQEELTKERFVDSEQLRVNSEQDEEIPLTPFEKGRTNEELESKNVGNGLSTERVSDRSSSKSTFSEEGIKGRFYKSGDKVRALKDGSLEFLGRIDKQVKIRGFRIELGEIESILNAFPAIKESTVILEETNNDKFLIAYIVTEDNQDIDNKELTNFLKSKVNNVMIPRHFVKMESIPLNHNGKVNKKALPKVDIINQQEKNGIYIKPENETENNIAKVLEELLGIKNISINDNFFDLGAHSLLMVEAHNKIQEKLSVSFDLIDTFNYPTIKTLAEFITGKSKKTSRKKRERKTDFDDIAIVGMAGKFPGAEDVEQFWKNIEQGVESIHFFTDEELKNKGISEDLINNPKYVKANGLLKNIEYFDADFWGYSPRETEILDPQHRLFLECAYHALEHAGYNPDSIDFPVGVFAGTSLSRYMLFNLANNQEIIDSVGYFQLLLANDKDYLATRTAYKLNLKGPAITLQTACSTSMVAVHSACQSILNGECDMALAGGVTIDTQQTGYLYQEGSIASPDGHCRAFSDKAQGIVGGSGAGIVVLKRLKDALKDNDAIYAVIKATAINNDGADKIGFLAPSIEGQSDVIVDALEKAKIKPEEIGYIEAHGTATPIGDPIEITALTKAFSTNTSSTPSGGNTRGVAIGSVKTNIGHLDSAAGVAGLIKTIQALRYKKLPPSLHYENPNPNINFKNSPFYVNNKLKEWKSENTRYAGVSSFGVGGTNAHAILSEAPQQITDSLKNNIPQLMVLSAKNPDSLKKSVDNFKNYLQENKDISLANAGYTLRNGRKEFNYRYSFVAENIEEAIKNLESFNDSEIHTAKKDKVVFMFSGLGSQYSQMAHGLYKNEAVFKENFDLCIEILKPLLGLDLKDIIFSENEYINKPQYMQPAIFSVEYALAKLWMSKGIKPYALIGHSFGEYVAACISEAISLENALKIVFNRGRLFEQVKGAMLSVSAPESEIKKYLSSDLSIAAVNGPNLCLVAGEEQEIEIFQTLLKEKQIASQKLEVPHATHSPLVKPIMDEFKSILENINWNEPKTPVISNLDGQFIKEFNAEYWLNHLLQPVRFFDGLNSLDKSENFILIEVGAGTQLSSIIKRNKIENLSTINSLPSKNKKENDYKTFLESLGKLWFKGFKINWNDELNSKSYKKTALPLYPFNRRKYWIEPSKDLVRKSEVNKFEDWFYIPSWKRTQISNNIPKKEGRYVLFTDDKLIYKQLSLEIPDLILVTFNRSILANKDIYYLKQENVYEDLFEKLESDNNFPENIIIDFTNTQYFSQNYLKGDIFDSFNQIIYLTHALAEYNKKFNINIIINDFYKINGTENINPNKSLIIGPSRVINQEYSNITCKIIDTDKITDIRKIVSEFNSNEAIVSYRNNYRWLQTFEKININEYQNGKNNSLKEKGTYLITGGLGGIGLTIAEFLVDDYQANLVLVNRFTDEKDNLISEKIKTMEKSGCKVLIKKADVTEFDSLEEIIKESIEEFGQIDGIIHAAGLAGDKLIQQKNNDNHYLIDVKVQSTKNLTRLAEDHKIKFVFLCSSLNSFLGGVGQVDYTAANAFLDSYSEFYESEDVKVISLNWGAWKNVGMAEKLNSKLPAFLKNPNESMTPKQGIEVFKTVINSEFNQIIASPVELDYLKDKYNKFSLAKGKEALNELLDKKEKNFYQRPELTNNYVAPETELETTIAEIWQDILGIEKIGMNDNFFELGGDSLNLAGIKLKVEDKLKIELPISLIFKVSTIKDLVDYLDKNEKTDVNEAIEENLITNLKGSGSKNPFFCIHAISGTTFPFVELAKNFDTDYPFYAIQARGLSDDKEPLNDIKEIAKLYIEQLKKIKSEGPYLIGGWSFGGIVALEVSQQLIASGDEIEKLIIMDMQAPPLDSSETLIDNELNEESLKEIFFTDMKGLFGEDVSLDNPDISKLYNIFKAHIKASQNYIAQPYSGKIELFKASQGIFKDTNSDYLRWSEITPSVNIYNIKGDHYSILKSEEFYKKLNNLINNDF